MASSEQDVDAATAPAPTASEPPKDKTEAADQANGKSDATKSEQSEAPLSKNQMKKLKRKAAWEESREDRKAKRRLKTKETRERKRNERRSAGQTGARPGRGRAVRVPVTIILDCGFEELMNEGELVSLSSQVTRSYSDKRKARIRPHMIVSSFGGKMRERFETRLTRNHESWVGVGFCEGDFVQAVEEARTHMRQDKGCVMAGAIAGKGTAQKDARAAAPGTSADGGETNEQNGDDENFSDDEEGGVALQIYDEPSKSEAKDDSGLPPDKTSNDEEQEPPEGEVIYLTSDSPNTLHELKPHGIYVIGGIVDKNRHKGLCYKRAKDHNISTAKLPIGEYLQVQGRQVLTTNHVNEIMLKWLELGDWREALMQVIPKRKGGGPNEDAEPADAQDEAQDAAQDEAQDEAQDDTSAEEHPPSGDSE